MLFVQYCMNRKRREQKGYKKNAEKDKKHVLREGKKTNAGGKYNKGKLSKSN
jgi:hypothetical protein